MPKTMNVYLVMKNADSMEGRGPMLIETAFFHGPHASHFIESQGGRDRGLWEVRELVVHEEQIDASAWQQEKVRQRALAKLTREEQRALGLGD